MNQRERFNRWYNDEWDKELITSPEDVEEAWAIWQAACPDGWQCVPKRMDRAMMSAAIPNDECEFPNYRAKEDEMQARYVRALSAAPKPEDV